jgi:hypothetical protein
MQVVAFDENGDGSYQCDAEATDELDFRDIVGSAFDWEADPVDWETPGEDHGYHNGTANLAYRVFSPGPLRLQFIADVEELFMAKITSALAEAGIPDATTTTTTDPILPEATL